MEILPNPKSFNLKILKM